MQKLRRGFTLIEAILAMMIVGVMALIFGAVFPDVLRASRTSGLYSQAAGLAQHKIEQLRGAGYAVLLTPAGLVRQGIADPGGTGVGLPYTVSFTDVDHLTGQPPQAGLLPPGSSGTIRVCDYSALNPAVPAGTTESVTVTVVWQGGGLTAGRYTTSTLLIQTPHS